MENKPIITAAMAIIMIAISPSMVMATKSSSSSIQSAWEDGLRDCSLGYSYWIDQHSNAGSHSATYMDNYNKAFVSCNNNNNNVDTSTTTHSQAQSANPQVTCSVLIGTCNTGQKTNQAQEDNSGN